MILPLPVVALMNWVSSVSTVWAELLRELIPEVPPPLLPDTLRLRLRFRLDSPAIDMLMLITPSFRLLLRDMLDL